MERNVASPTFRRTALTSFESGLFHLTRNMQ
jgi:hypothetical protein